MGKQSAVFQRMFIICPTAIAEHGTDYKTLASCLSVIYGRNTHSILMTICTIVSVWNPKSNR